MNLDMELPLDQKPDPAKLVVGDGWNGVTGGRGKARYLVAGHNTNRVSRDWNLDGGCSAGWLADLSGWNGLWRATPFQPGCVVLTHGGDLGLRVRHQQIRIERAAKDWNVSSTEMTMGRLG